MAQKLPKKDVAIIGLGWTGSILAHELTDEGLDVIAIERGPWRDAPTDFPTTYVQDELRYRIRHELFLRPEQMTFTFRNKMSEQALPIRFRLLAVLTENPGRVLTHDRLLELVWGDPGAVLRDQVKLYVGYLRKKIELDPAEPRLILTARGIGYRYQPPTA